MESYTELESKIQNNPLKTEEENKILHCKKDYKDQEITQLSKYQLWYNQVSSKYKIAKIFYCKKDNIFYFSEKKDKSKLKNCPLCKIYICPYCDATGQYKSRIGKCCVKGRIFSTFDFFLSPLDDDIYNEMAPFIFIPFINMISCIGAFNIQLYWTLSEKMKECDHSLFPHHRRRNDRNRQSIFKYVHIMIIHLLFALVLAFPFSLQFAIIIFVLYLLSFCTNHRIIRKLSGFFEL